jgi:hypothetical protein
MSYYQMTQDMYGAPPAATVGWQFGPVPGWGTNPLRAGPKRVGVGCRTCGVGQDDNGGLGGLGIVVAGVAIGAILLMAMRSPLARA